VADPWWEAHQVAKEAGVSWVGTDMLLVGLTRSEGIAREVLAAAGVTDDAIASRVIEANRLAARPPAPDPEAPPRPTPAAEHALGRADGFAVGLGIADRSASLLLALLYDRTGIHSGDLRHLGADRTEIVRDLAARGVPVPPTMPPPEPAPFTDTVVLPDEQARVVAEELAQRSVEDPAFWFDAWGKASWGYGGIPDRPGDAHIAGESRINLRQLVPEILAAHGYPAPPDAAWRTRDVV
jgi:hypothetical protein